VSLAKPSEYRRQVYKEVSVPSGFVFKIRKMPIHVTWKFFDLLEVRAPAEAESAAEAVRAALDRIDMVSKLPAAMKLVITECVVEPTIVAEGKPSDEHLLFDELSPGDVFELFSAILDFSGMTEEAGEERRKTRGSARVRIRRKPRR